VENKFVPYSASSSAGLPVVIDVGKTAYLGQVAGLNHDGFGEHIAEAGSGLKENPHPVDDHQHPGIAGE